MPARLSGEERLLMAELAALRDPCEEDGCDQFVCYRSCCLVPSWLEIHHAWCHDHVQEVRGPRHKHEYTCRHCGRSMKSRDVIGPTEDRRMPEGVDSRSRAPDGGNPNPPAAVGETGQEKP